MRTILGVGMGGLLLLTGLSCREGGQDSNGPGGETGKVVSKTTGDEKAPEKSEQAKKPDAKKKGVGDGDKVDWAPAVKPKALSAQVSKGLQWLVSRQHENGGWAEGEESAQMGDAHAALKDKPNLGDTCIAILALLRSGSTPTEGPYAGAIRKGLGFVCRSVEGAEDSSLYVTPVRGTRLQQKLGNYIDTFLASMVLAEVKDRLADAKSNKRALVALQDIRDRIQKNQKADGTFGEQGWANSLSLSVASKGMNRSSQAGVQFAQPVLLRAQDEGTATFDAVSGEFAKEKSAGVDLYASSATLAKMRESSNTYRAKGGRLRAVVASPETAPADRAAALEQIERFEKNEKLLEQAQGATVKKLDDARFVAGFGSNGGEEFLSYMNIGESLVVDGGKEWETWDKKITENLNRIQNADGSWTGHHCITGRTFCTSAALLCLMVDRAPVPVAARIGKGR